MDVITTVVMLGLVNIMLAIALFLQSRFNSEIPGVRWWPAGQTLLAGGLIVSALRGDSLLGKVAVPLWQTMTITGIALVYVGVLRFFHRRERWVPLVLLVTALALWSTYFTFVIELVPPRATAVYVCASGLVLACAQTVAKWGRPVVGESATFLRIVFTSVGAVYVVLAAVQASRWNQPQAMLAGNPMYTTAYIATACGTVLWVCGLIFMVSERLQNAIAAQSDNMARIFATSPDCAIISRLDDGLIVNVNDGFSRVTGYTRSEAIGHSFLALGFWGTPLEREHFLEHLGPTGNCENVPVVVRRKDGSALECLLSASTLNLDGTLHVISITRDVTEQRDLEARLKHDATTDPLTGITNRRHFLSLAQGKADSIRGSDEMLCVAIIDIDGFKQINDLIGHAAGDAALVHFAEVAAAVIRDSDILGRLGGDEFGVLLPETNLEVAFDVVETIRIRLSSAPVPGLPMAEGPLISMSAGVAALGPCSDSLEHAMARADIALYQAKTLGRGRTVRDG